MIHEIKYKNSKGLTRAALIRGYVERKKVRDGTVTERLVHTAHGTAVIREAVEVSLYHDACFHAQRSDWTRIRDGNGGNGDPAWYASASLTAARRAAVILRSRLLTQEDIDELNKLGGR